MPSPGPRASCPSACRPRPSPRTSPPSRPRSGVTTAAGRAPAGRRPLCRGGQPWCAATPTGYVEGERERRRLMGITDKVTGRVKKAAGDLTGKAALRREGREEERKGEAKE